jgi:hypothetical protein
MKDFTNNIVTSLMACVVAMIAFWMVEARNYVTRDETIKLIESNSPYSQDKNMIMAELSRTNLEAKDMKRSNDETREVLSELKVEIAVLNKVLQNIQDDGMITGSSN